MVPKFCTALFSLFITVTAFSQQPIYQWAKAFIAHNDHNANVYSNGRSVAVDQNGNVYSTGLFTYTTDFDPGPGVFTLTAAGNFSHSIYVSKLSPTGDFLWAFQIPALVEFGNIEITLDKEGNVYVGSELRDTTDFDPGPGDYILTPIGGWDAFVAKYDPNGNLVWAKQFGGPGDTVPRTDVLATDNDNNVIVCGNFNNIVDFDPGPGTFNMTSSAHIQSFVVKLDKNGDFTWARQLGSSPMVYSGASIKDVRCDQQGNIYTVGNFAGSCDFDPGSNVFTLAATGLNDGFIAKLDAMGQFSWARQIGNTTNDYHEFAISRGLALDNNNNVYTTGAFLGTFDFDPGENKHTVTSENYDWYVLKLNANGDFVWVDVLGGQEPDEGTDIEIDNAGNVFAIGGVGPTADMDPGPGVFTTTSEGIYGAAAMVRLNAGGGLMYAGLVDGDGSVLLRRMTIDPTANVYVTGYYYGNMDFDPGPGKAILQYSHEMAPYVVKYGKCPNVTTSTLNISRCDRFTLNNEVFDSTGTYIRTIMNTTGCDSVITLNLTITKKYEEQTKTICEGESLLAGGRWQTETGVYIDTFRTSLNCDSIVTTILTVHPKPLPNLGVDKDLCAGTQAVINPGSFERYLWQDGSGSNSLTVSAPGLYWVKVYNSFNCNATDSFTVKSMLQVPSGFLKETDSICRYDKVDIRSLQRYDRYMWSTGSTQNQTVINTPGRYWLEVTDENGCVGRDSITIFQKDCMNGVFIPNAFTPNNDGKNDYFKAMVFGSLKSFRLQVFDRAGQLIFETSDPRKGWDGTNKGTGYSASVFVWQCTYQLDQQKPAFQKGTVTIIR